MLLVLETSCPWGIEWLKRVLLTDTVMQFSFWTCEDTSASNGKWPPSCEATFAPFNH